MSDMQTLLVNRIRDALDKLSKEGVGYTNIECSSGFQYIIDERAFCIEVKELGKEEN